MNQSSHEVSGFPSRWIPVASGVLADQIRDAIDGIAQYLAAQLALNPHERSGPWTSPSFAGYAGVSLFFHYLELSGLFDGAAEVYESSLSRALELAEKQPAESGLISGFLGTAWLLEHTGNGACLEPSDDITAGLTRFVESSQGWIDFDLVSGMVGFGVYAIERAREPGSRDCLEAIVSRLERTALEINGGNGWETPPRGNYPYPRFDLGTAHGLPGVIQMLAQIRRLGIKSCEADELTRKAIDFLLTQEIGSPSRFASSLVRHRAPDPSRLGWCYGDLGLAGALRVAGDCLGSERISQIALETALHAARRSPESSGVVDETLCHGTSGLSHMFNRFFQASDDQVFADASNYWLRRTLEFSAKIRGGETGLGFVWRLNEKGWAKQPGLLMGAAGVGLALLGAVTSLEPRWDRLLLLSARNESLRSTS